MLESLSCPCVRIVVMITVPCILASVGMLPEEHNKSYGNFDK